ncbi:amino acid permease [Kockovaella imperatae]|uniref:Amino acid permease n=1 Tax=Kockovaella imperatae TaxID=4999 RepID=A0A1Y1U8E6_9TREE|nr:amino acid permease [Kockovaella imperatae]ORX34311.1 amino acid permease [Kockovaella imperatae]
MSAKDIGSEPKDEATMVEEPVHQDYNLLLKQSLKSRHLQMMAIGGVIGPGYFVGLGNGFHTGGPAGLLLGFGIVGALLWAVMQSLGEMASYLAVSGAFTDYAGRLLDPAIGFSLGWNYCFLWFGIIANEYNNLGLILTYWPSKMPNYGFILVFWVVFLLFAYLGVLAFGEAEFFITATKLIFILAFFLCAILISSGAIGTQGPVGFRYYHDPGAFVDGVEGVFKIFVFAALLYSGTEMIGLTAGESANPARDVPKAIKLVFWRVLILYIGGIFFLSICIPSNAEGLLHASSKTASSPFVIAFTRAGMGAGGDVVNAFIIVTIVSAINGGLYVSSRCVTALARAGAAPKFLGHINKRGVPYAALAFCNLFGLLSLLNLSSSAGEVFTWLVTITGVATFITWGCISLCHIRFRKALKLQGIPIEDLPFRAPLYPYGAWFGMLGSFFFVFFQGWTAFLSPFSVATFFQNYMMIPVFFIMWAGYKFWNKTKWVDLAEADLVTGRRMPTGDSVSLSAKKGIWTRISDTIVG